jgi:uroporphyrin-III C-methyltransferase
VGKRAGICSLKQKEISDLLRESALSCPVGAYVVRLKGGDPSVFGRLDEEINTLNQSHILFEMVPGISAGLACAAAVKRPLTQRHKIVKKNARSVAFVTFSHASDGDAFTRVPEADTLVIYMAGQPHSQLYQKLISHLGGKWHTETPIAWVAGASTEGELVYRGTLRDLVESPISLMSFFDKATQHQLALSLLVGEVLNESIE